MVYEDFLAIVAVGVVVNNAGQPLILSHLSPIIIISNARFDMLF